METGAVAWCGPPKTQSIEPRKTTRKVNAGSDGSSDSGTICDVPA